VRDEDGLHELVFDRELGFEATTANDLLTLTIGKGVFVRAMVDSKARPYSAYIRDLEGARFLVSNSLSPAVKRSDGAEVSSATSSEVLRMIAFLRDVPALLPHGKVAVAPLDDRVATALASHVASVHGLGTNVDRARANAQSVFAPGAPRAVISFSASSTRPGNDPLRVEMTGTALVHLSSGLILSITAQGSTTNGQAGPKASSGRISLETACTHTLAAPIEP